jgi:hypothetical protein
LHAHADHGYTRALTCSRTAQIHFTNKRRVHAASKEPQGESTPTASRLVTAEPFHGNQLKLAVCAGSSPSECLSTRRSVPWRWAETWRPEQISSGRLRRKQRLCLRRHAARARGLSAISQSLAHDHRSNQRQNTLVETSSSSFCLGQFRALFPTRYLASRPLFTIFGVDFRSTLLY